LQQRYRSKAKTNYLIVVNSIGITGLVVLGGHTSVKDPKANFRNAFEGTGAATVYGTTNALTKVWFSYAGYENAFNVVNEVRVWVPTSFPNVDR
jgi:amino acid transporter